MKIKMKTWFMPILNGHIHDLKAGDVLGADKHSKYELTLLVQMGKAEVVNA